MDMERIIKIAKTQFPSKQIEVGTIAKDFKIALEPTAPFVYEDA